MTTDAILLNLGHGFFTDEKDIEYVKRLEAEAAGAERTRIGNCPNEGLSAEDRAKAEIVLQQLSDLQQAFWDKASELENILGCDIDTSDELAGYSVDDFLDQ